VKENTAIRNHKENKLVEPEILGKDMSYELRAMDVGLDHPGGRYQ